MNFSPVKLFLGFVNFLSAVRSKLKIRMDQKLISQRNYLEPNNLIRKTDNYYQKNSPCATPNFYLYNTRIIPVLTSRNFYNIRYR